MIEAYLFPKIELISDQPTLTTLCIIIVTFLINTNDSAVNTKVVQNSCSTIPPSTNPHSTKQNASNKSAQKFKQCVTFVPKPI